MTTATAKKAKTAVTKPTPKEAAKRRAARRDRAVKLRFRDHQRKNGATFRRQRAERLWEMLNAIRDRAAELRDLIYAAMDETNETFLAVASGGQDAVDSLFMDLNASPRDLDMLVNACENNVRPNRSDL